VRAAEPVTPSVVALIVAVPFRTPVARPEALTVATVVSEELHVKVFPEIVFPDASFATG
jgi:hypothetical protein